MALPEPSQNAQLAVEEPEASDFFKLPAEAEDNNLREATIKSAAQDKYGPRPVLLLRMSSDGRTTIDGFVVPGTNNFWGVYASDENKDRWVPIHLPTGLSLRENCANRDMAEALACWCYCQGRNHPDHGSSSSNKVVESMGARGRSAFRKGQPFMVKGRQLTQRIGKNETVQAAGEAMWAARLESLEGERRLELTHLSAKLEDIKAREKAVQQRADVVAEADLKAQRHWEQRHAVLETQSATLTSREEAIRESNAAAVDDTLAAARQLANARDAETELQAMREQLISAITTIDPAGAEDTRVGRQLRKIRLTSD